MHYEGSFDVKATKEKVYDFVTDPKKVTTIFPDVQSVKVVDEDNFSAQGEGRDVLHQGDHGREANAGREEAGRPSSKLKARGTGLNSSVDLESSFTLADGPDGGTHVNWSADAKISGMMASVGSRLIDSAADKYVKQIIGSLEKKLS